MLKSGDVLDLGPLDTRFLIKKTGADTDGRSFEMEWELGPHTGGTPVHIHPHAVETYEVLEGALDLFVDDTWRTLGRGEKLSVDKGVPHTFRNSTGATTRVYNTHRPAMRFEAYFEGLDAVVNSGSVSSGRMTPAAILHLSVLMTSYPDEIRSVRPPRFVMSALAFVGRMLGYRVKSTA